MEETTHSKTKGAASPIYGATVSYIVKLLNKCTFMPRKMSYTSVVTLGLSILVEKLKAKIYQLSSKVKTSRQCNIRRTRVFTWEE